MGDTLHTQGNGVAGQTGALDSAWLLDTRKDYAIGTNAPVRIIAAGARASATIDSSLLGSAGFQNDGDNELTGIHVSDGDAGHRRHPRREDSAVRSATAGVSSTRSSTATT